MLELSSAIKCPNIDMQLVTFKKVQEALNSSAWKNKILTNELDELKYLFDGMWSFENEEET